MPRKVKKTLDKPSHRVQFAERLVAARIAAGFEDQKDFAKAIAAEPATYGRWERAETEPNLLFLARIAEATGKPLDWLIMGNGPVRRHATAIA